MTAMALLFVFGLALAAEHSPPARALSVKATASTIPDKSVSYSAPATSPVSAEIALKSEKTANIAAAHRVRSGAGITKSNNPVRSNFDEPDTPPAETDLKIYESPPFKRTASVSNKAREKI